MPKRLIPGQRLKQFPAGTFNKLVDMLGKVGSYAPPPGDGDVSPGSDLPILTAPCKNISGESLVERGVVGISGSAFTPPDITDGDDGDIADEAILTGVPIEVDAFDGGPWGLMVSPAGSDPPDDHGHIIIMGLVWARVDITDSTHTCAVPQSGDLRFLTSATTGAPMAPRRNVDGEIDDSLGKQWRLILIGAGTGGGGGGTSAKTGNIILIDFDFGPVDEADPAELLEAADIAGDPLTGTADDGDADTMILEEGASIEDGFYDDATFAITGGAGVGQSGTIGDYDGATRTVTFNTTLGTPLDNTSEYTITPLPVIFQDPPDDDFDTNNVDNLNLWSCKPPNVLAKYFHFDSTTITGTADDGDADTMVLEAGASAVDGFYDDATFTITGGTGEGQSGTIGDYDGATLTATFNATLDTPLDDTSEYEITYSDNLKLVTTTIDDPDHMDGDDPAPRKIVRYATRKVYYIDGKEAGFSREFYTKNDYPDYPENEFFDEDTDPDGNWGPDGTGTFKQMPRDYFKKRYRASTDYRLGKEWIDWETCIELPPPQLIEVEDDE